MIVMDRVDEKSIWQLPIPEIVPTNAEEAVGHLHNEGCLQRLAGSLCSYEHCVVLADFDWACKNGECISSDPQSWRTQQNLGRPYGT